MSALELAKDPPDNPEEAELKALRAERAAIAAARRAREAERSTGEQIVAERLALADDQAIDKAEAEHGPIGKRIALVRTDLGTVILKRAHPHIFKRYSDKGSIKSTDLEALVRPSLVYPEVGKFDAILEDLPATLMRCADAIAVLAGVRTEELQGK